MPIDRVSARRMLCQSTHGAPLVAPLVFVGLALVVLRARRRRPLASACANGKTIV
jgi:MYXO-CTERM domain-containing protein